MGSRRRLNKKTSWESTSLPVRNPLQPRPFGKGIQARRAELPTTNVLQTRPFGTPKQASSPKQEMPDLQAQLKQAESFGYNAANIPTVPSSNATPIQAKLTIGEPNDKYEQEADQVASQVVNQINSPQSQPSVQGKTLQRETLPPEDEEEEIPVSAKLESGTLQRETLPPEEEEETPVSAKLESGTLQRETLPPEEEEETPVSAKLESGTLQRETLPPEEEEETPVSAKLESGTLQRETLPPEEEEETPVSAKLESGTLQRETLPPEEEEEETPVSAKLESDTIQRQGIPPEEEEKKKISPKLMRKSQSGTGSTTATANLEESIQQERGKGQSISENIRQPMEQAFGADFSGVKIHTDSQADQLNRSIQARAFTTGQDIFFRQGEYNPGTKDGLELLAHETTHVLQQTGGESANQVQRRVSIDITQKCISPQFARNLTDAELVEQLEIITEHRTTLEPGSLLDNAAQQNIETLQAEQTRRQTAQSVLQLANDYNNIPLWNKEQSSEESAAATIRTPYLINTVDQCDEASAIKGLTIHRPPYQGRTVGTVASLPFIGKGTPQQVQIIAQAVIDNEYQSQTPTTMQTYINDGRERQSGRKNGKWGVDCSGFTSILMSELAGEGREDFESRGSGSYRLAHGFSAVKSESGAGYTPISPEQAQPGDVLNYETTNHVTVIFNQQNVQLPKIGGDTSDTKPATMIAVAESAGSQDTDTNQYIRTDHRFFHIPNATHLEGSQPATPPIYRLGRKDTETPPEWQPELTNVSYSGSENWMENYTLYDPTDSGGTNIRERLENGGFNMTSVQIPNGSSGIELKEVEQNHVRVRWNGEETHNGKEIWVPIRKVAQEGEAFSIPRQSGIRFGKYSVVRRPNQETDTDQE